MILVTGYNGQLGYDVVKTLKRKGVECLGIDIQDLDITNKIAVNDFIFKLKPKLVIHCAAYTAVDKAEDDVETCTKVNVDGTKHIAEACKLINATMVYISTDYVFEGTGNQFYEVNDKLNPISVYGKTKRDGELIVKKLLEKYFIVRISWVFGINGNNFINTMIKLGLEKDELNVVDDQIGSPTYTHDLAILISDMILTEKYGTYHATNEGTCSWADFAKYIMKEAGLNCKINPILTSEYPTRAKRPANSRLSKSKLDCSQFCRLPSWQSAVSSYIKIMKDNGSI